MKLPAFEEEVGTKFDAEHGTPHMAHVAVNAMFLDYLDRSGPVAERPSEPEQVRSDEHL